MTGNCNNQFKIHLVKLINVLFVIYKITKQQNVFSLKTEQLITE